MGELIIRDGQDGTIGATTDAAITSDADGTLSGKLRGLVKILASAWDAVNGRIKVDGAGVTQPVTVIKSDIVTGNVSTAGGTVTCELGNNKTVTFGLSGTHPNLVCAFEASIDDSNWYEVLVQRMDTIADRVSSLAIGNNNYSFIASVNGFRWFRVRVTAILSGTATIWIAPTDTSINFSDAKNTVSISGNTTVNGCATNYTFPNVSIAYGYVNCHFKISLASTNATSVKASDAQVGLIALSNQANSWRYFKLYNKSSAPNVGTDTPVLIVGIPPADHVELHNQAGLRLQSGLAYAITTLPAVSDTTAIGADDVIVNIIYL